MGDDISSGLSSMAVCFDFRSTNVVQLSNGNPYFYQFRCHHPLITQLNMGDICKICEKMTDSSQLILSLTIISFQWFAEHAWLSRFTIFFPEYDLRHLKKKILSWYNRIYYIFHLHTKNKPRSSPQLMG